MLLSTCYVDAVISYKNTTRSPTEGAIRLTVASLSLSLSCFFYEPETKAEFIITVVYGILCRKINTVPLFIQSLIHGTQLNYSGKNQ